MYLDPVVVYIEKLFIKNPPYLFSIFVAVQGYQAPSDEDQARNSYQIPVTGLFLSLVENNERTKLLEKLLAWLH